MPILQRSVGKFFS